MSPTVKKTPSATVSPIFSASQRKTGAVRPPFTVPTRMRPTACGVPPKSANAPAAEITHTGIPRNVRQLPLSANPLHRTRRSPAESSQGSRFRRTAR